MALPLPLLLLVLLFGLVLASLSVPVSAVDVSVTVDVSLDDAAPEASSYPVEPMIQDQLQDQADEESWSPVISDESDDSDVFDDSDDEDWVSDSLPALPPQAGHFDEDFLHNDPDLAILHSDSPMDFDDSAAEEISREELLARHPEIPPEAHGLIEGLSDGQAEVNAASESSAVRLVAAQQSFANSLKSVNLAVSDVENTPVNRIVSVLPDSMKCRGYLSSGGQRTFLIGVCMPTSMCRLGIPLSEDIYTDGSESASFQPCAIRGSFLHTCCAGGVDRGQIEPVLDNEWNEKFLKFSYANQKTYKPKEFQLRKEIFKANYKLINKHNASPKAKQYTLAINPLADLTVAEMTMRSSNSEFVKLAPSTTDRRQRRVQRQTQGQTPIGNNLPQSPSPVRTTPKTSRPSSASRKLLQTAPAADVAPDGMKITMPNPDKSALCRYPRMDGYGVCYASTDACFKNPGALAFSANPRLCPEQGKQVCCIAKTLWDQYNERPWFEEWPKEDITVDWRTKPVNTPVKSQGRCGSCFAQAAVALIETYASIRGDLPQPPPALSIQQFMSCSKAQNWCNGGATETSFEWYAENGVCLEADFPYEAANGSYVIPTTPPAQCSCKRSLEPWVTKGVNTDFNWVGFKRYLNAKDEAIIKLLETGPVGFRMLVGQDLSMFERGIYNPSTCDPEGGHIMIIYGYGVDKKTSRPYWIVRNSWNANWGSRGYFRIARGSNLCTLNNYVLVPDFSGTPRGDLSGNDLIQGRPGNNRVSTPSTVSPKPRTRRS